MIYKDTNPTSAPPCTKEHIAPGSLFASKTSDNNLWQKENIQKYKICKEQDIYSNQNGKINFLQDLRRETL